MIKNHIIFNENWVSNPNVLLEISETTKEQILPLHKKLKISQNNNFANLSKNVINVLDVDENLEN